MNAACTPAAAPAILYEHRDGRYRVATSPEQADLARDDPAWHRVGPVDVFALREVVREEVSHG